MLKESFIGRRTIKRVVRVLVSVIVVWAIIHLRGADHPLAFPWIPLLAH